MMDKKQCVMTVESHPTLGEIFEVRGDCGDKIKSINANQGPYKEKSFNRRLVFIDDKASTNLSSNASKE